MGHIQDYEDLRIDLRGFRRSENPGSEDSDGLRISRSGESDLLDPKGAINGVRYETLITIMVIKGTYYGPLNTMRICPQLSLMVSGYHHKGHYTNGHVHLCKVAYEGQPTPHSGPL